MKRLFAIKSGKDGKLITSDGKETLYFDNKMEAKKVRNELNGGSLTFYYITRGPDHIGPHGNHNPKRKNKEARNG